MCEFAWDMGQSEADRGSLWCNSLQVVTLSLESHTPFSISPPTLRRLVRDLTTPDRVTRLDLVAVLTRSVGDGGRTFEVRQQHELTNASKIALVEALTSHKGGVVELSQFYTPFLTNNPSGIHPITRDTDNAGQGQQVGSL